MSESKRFAYQRIAENTRPSTVRRADDLDEQMNALFIDAYANLFAASTSIAWTRN